MDENVLASLALDESKSLAGIEPLHCSLFSQLCVSFLFELFGAFPTAFSQNKKGCKCGLAAPSINLKVLQEQQTQSDHLTLSPQSPLNLTVTSSGIPSCVPSVCAPSCVRTVSKLYLFWPLGLAFERKADAPSYCKETKMEANNRASGVSSAASKADALPAELHAHANSMILNNSNTSSWQMIACSRSKYSLVESHAGMGSRPLCFLRLTVLLSSTESSIVSPLPPPVSDRETGKRTQFLHRLGTALFLVPSSDPNLQKARNLSQRRRGVGQARAFGSRPSDPKRIGDVCHGFLR
jgi:hypothetical protein